MLLRAINTIITTDIGFNGNELLDVIFSIMFNLNVPDSKVYGANTGPSDALNHGIFKCFWENFRVMCIKNLNHI